MNKYMMLAHDEAMKNVKNNFKHGGPFGAVIVKDDLILAKEHNTVLLSQDPTAHAEINAIRMASKKLGTHNLCGCVLYTNAYPCPMCLSAIIWSNIKVVYYGNSIDDADKIGFRDKKIYDYLNRPDSTVLEMINQNRNLTIKSFDEFEKNRNLY